MNAAELIEEIALRIEKAGRDPLLNLAWMYPNEAAALVRSFAADFDDDSFRDCHAAVPRADEVELIPMGRRR